LILKAIKLELGTVYGIRYVILGTLYIWIRSWCVQNMLLTKSHNKYPT